MFGQAKFAAVNAALNARFAQHGTLVAVHRGTGIASVVENTSDAVTAAVASGGDIVEIDVLASADGAFFAFHEGEEQRLLGIDADLRRMAAAEIDVLSYVHADRPGRTVRVERLLELLARFRGSTLFNVDRSWGWWAELLPALDTLDMAGQLLLKSWANDDHVRLLREHPVKYPYLPICASIEEAHAHLDDPDLNIVGVELLAIDQDSPFLDPATIAELHRRGAFVLVNAEVLTTGVPLFCGVDDEVSVLGSPAAGWGRLFELGVDVIQTDWPWLLRDYRAGRVTPSPPVDRSPHPVPVNQKPARVRLEDVAAEAGVSRTSASRVMLDQGKVSQETRRRVWAAADRLGYVTNVMASELASGGSATIGLLLRDAANPAYGLLFTELQKAAHDDGLTLVTMTISADDRGRAQVASLHRLMGMRVAGLIVATGGVTSEQLEPFRTRIPIMRSGRPETTDLIHAVSYDEEDAARRLAEHVAGLGHCDVAVLVTREEDSYPEFVRGSTMAAGLAARGVRVSRIDVGGRSEEVEAAVALAKAGQVTAVMCPSDLRQLNVLRALTAWGLRVPQDVSVTGCDGILPGADLMGLTTLRIPVEEVARRTIARMAALLRADRPAGIVNERLPGELVPGSTAGPPPR